MNYLYSLNYLESISKKGVGIMNYFLQVCLCCSFIFLTQPMEEENPVPRSESEELLRKVGCKITEENHKQFIRVAKKKHKKANTILHPATKKILFFWTKTPPEPNLETLREGQLLLYEAAQLYLAIYHITASEEHLKSAKKIIKKEILMAEVNQLKDYPTEYEISEAYSSTWQLLRETQAKKRGDAPN